ncbi:hypothetical protein COLO4_24937 [Corchorus olitorius]|uniref:Uncharacterized protein n=1 Tax=Corchorus olitorius TaxID=93759 RepID=A0A1R3I5U2_9ROSI|nr:hypothetical protein COLO4_24937 [Corchorus olitorius]
MQLDGRCEILVTMGAKSRRAEIYDFLHQYYSPETYAKAYQYSLNPINGPNEWKRTGREPMLPPLQPEKPRGRPKKNRRKTPDELTSKTGKMSKATVGAVRGESNIPKRRGRPPKDKGKAAGDNGQPSLPKKRGRPPKNPRNGGNQFLNGEPTTKRKGRPPKDTATTSLGKTSSKGYGNYVNEKTGQSQFYLFNPEAFRTQGCSSTSRGTGSSKTATKSTMTCAKKRKANADPIGTQESVKQKK